jgi:hypothetical protein
MLSIIINNSISCRGIHVSEYVHGFCMPLSQGLAGEMIRSWWNNPISEIPDLGEQNETS